MGWMDEQGYQRVLGLKNYTKSYIRGGRTTKDFDEYLISKALLKSYLRDGRRTKDIDEYLVSREPLKKERRSAFQDMEVNSVQRYRQDEEEFVLLDLSSVSGEFDIPANAPYVLSGLDTLNPVLIIDGKLKLIGEYEETIGTCLVFTEEDGNPVVHEENLMLGFGSIQQSRNVS
nr:hypothetical protein CFP56_23271 [Quercus suber]